MSEIVEDHIESVEEEKAKDNAPLNGVYKGTF